jgi:S1-C subfamily serine protease
MRRGVYSASKPAAKPQAPAVIPAAKPATPRKKRNWRTPALTAAALLLVAAIALMWSSQPRPLGPEDVQYLVAAALEKRPPRPTAADAYEVIRPSVVLVRGMPDDGEEGTKGMAEGKAEVQKGTGVVILENGTILTNLHVVAGARRIRVMFFDGHESEAEVIGQRPEHDLAVLVPKSTPDDLVPATMRSTNGLRVGEEVVAVGFPFGIGPSASAGVVSGLKREYVSPEGKRLLTNLIQFDAAVNPGNSGGPLVTLDGELVGIVTGLLNPTEQRVFVGIGFAVPIENAASAVGLSPF